MCFCQYGAKYHHPGGIGTIKTWDGEGEPGYWDKKIPGIEKWERSQSVKGGT